MFFRKKVAECKFFLEAKYTKKGDTQKQLNKFLIALKKVRVFLFNLFYFFSESVKYFYFKIVKKVTKKTAEDKFFLERKYFEKRNTQKQVNKALIFFKKIKIFLFDHVNLLFKSAKYNHLKIVARRYGWRWHYNPKLQSLQYLKNYQKKLKLYTLASSSIVACSLLVFIFFAFKSYGATFGWVQTTWSGGVDVVATATHEANQTGWTKFESKDVGVDVTSSPGDIKIVSTPDAVAQTTDADFNVGAMTNTQVNGTGTAGNVSLTKKPLPVSGTKWSTVQKSVPGVGSGGAIVSIGDFVYVLKGATGRGFLRYSIIDNTWSALALLPSGVSVGSLVYAGGDIYALNGSGGFYRYSISGNSWTSLVGGVFNYGGSSLVYPGAGDFLYTPNGNGSTAWSRYSISGNSWTSMPVLPVGVNAGGSFVAANTDTLYLLRGGNNTDFYKYIISTATWTAVTGTPAGIGDGGFLVNSGTGDFYALAGNNSTTFYKYTIATNLWTTVAPVLGTIYSGAGLAYPGSGDYIYCTRGSANAGGSDNFFRYQISTNTWTIKAVIPGTFFGSGAGLVAVGSDTLFGTRGAGTAFFYRYSISGASWTPMASAPGNISTGGALAYAGSGDFIYALAGGSSTAFYKYTISTNSWTTMTVAPGNIGAGGALVFSGASDSVYALAGGSSTAFYKYTISTNSWTTIAVVPGTIGAGGALVYYPTSNVFYATGGNGGTAFYRYAVSGNSWTTMTVAPGTIGAGGALVYPGSGDYIYITRGNNFTDLYRYSISGSSWNTLAGSPGTFADGGAIAFPASGSSFFATKGGDTSVLYRYVFADTSAPTLWTAMASSPGATGDGSASVYYSATNSVYTTRGGGTTNFYRYTADTNSWTAMASTPGNITGGSALVYSGGNDIYALAGGGSALFYRYSISGNSWTPVTSILGNVGNGGSLVYTGGDVIYASRGNNTTDFYKYTISTNSWTSMTSLPAGASSGSSAVVYPSGDNIYIVKGNIMYRYSITGNSWATLATCPNWIANGASLIYPGSGDYLFLLTANGFSVNYRYYIPGDYFIMGTPAPSMVNIGGGLVYAGNGNAYGFLGGTAGFFRYQIESDSFGSWTAMTPTSLATNAGASLVATGGDFVYGFMSSSSKTFYRYSISGNSWTAKASFPIFPGANAGLVYPGSGDYLYAGVGGSNALYRYSIIGNNWTQLPSMAGNVGNGGAIVATGENIYVAQGAGTDSFFKYSIADNTWTTMTPYPDAAPLWGGSMVYPGSGDFIYFTIGYTSTFYRYSISGDNWALMASAPNSFAKGSTMAYPGSGDFIYVIEGSYQDAFNNQFFCYSISTNSWMTLPTIPGSGGVNEGASLVYPGSGSYLYATRGKSSTDFSRFTIPTYLSSGSFTSAVQDTGRVSNLSSLSYGAVVNSQTFSMDVRAGNTAIPDGTWSSWLTNVSNGGDISSLSGKRYAQYRANLTTNDTGVSPILNDTSIGYHYYPTNQTLVSSPYDTTDMANVLSKIQWTKSLASNTGIAFQIRTSPDKINWTSWEGPDGTSATTFTDSTGGESMPADFTNVGANRYLQSKVILTSDGASTPTLSDSTLTYVVNAPPTIESVSATQDAAASKVVFSYTIKDTDTTTGMYTPNFVTPTFQYSLDGGLTWHNILDADYTYKATPLFGQIVDINADGKPDNKVLTGAALTYAIDWNAQQQLGVATDVSNAKVRVTINDNEPANNTAILASSNFSLSTLAISNIVVSQSNQVATLGKVIIDYTYTTQSNVQPTANVALQYWNGSGWIPATTLTGDSGFNLANGNRQIIWDAKQDYSQYYGTSAKIRLVANYGGTNQYLASGDFRLDTKNPTNVSFTIDRSKTSDQLSIATPTDDSSYQMAFSNFSDFSDNPTYAVFSNSATYSNFLTDPTTVYVRIKDDYGNYTQSSTITPLKIQNIVYYDVSVPTATPPTYGEFITWDVIPAQQAGSGGFSQYDIYRAERLQTNPGATLTYSKITSIRDRTLNYYFDSYLSTAKHYYYKVLVVDSLGNAPVFSSTVDDVPNGQGGTDQTPPTITNVAVTNIYTTSATVTWTTDELSDSGAGYSTDTSYMPERTVPSMVTSHRETISNLLPDTTYNIRLKSRDASGNLGQVDKDEPGANQSNNFTFKTLPGPIISAVSIPNVSNNQASIEWRTTIDSSTYVQYSEFVSNGTLVSPVLTGSPDLIGGSAPFQHDQIITGLTTGKTYYFVVKSVDALGNIAIDDNAGEFYSLTTTSDIVPPNGVNDPNNPIIVNDTQAVLHFTTSENSVNRTFYKKTADSSFTAMDWGMDYNVDHFVILEGLSKDTAYQYYFQVKDINGNQSTSPLHDFATTQTQGHANLSGTGDPATLQFSDTDAVVTIPTLNTDATSALCFSKNFISNMTNCAQSISFDTPSRTNFYHLTNLDPNTTYHIRAKVTDSLTPSINFTSNDTTFTTKRAQQGHADLTGTSDPVALQVFDAEAVVTIPTLNTEATSVLCYGTSAIVDMANCSQSLTFNTPSATHFYHLMNLNPNVVYHIRVKVIDSIDSSLNFTSNDVTFTTKEVQQGHTDLTGTSDPAALQVFDTEAVVTIPTLNTDATSVLCYGTSAITDMASCAQSLTFDTPSAANFYHLINLNPNTTYHIRVKVTDSLTPSINFTSSDATFTTKKVQLGHSDLTGTDNPVIMQFSDTDAVVTIPTLNTDATSTLCYGTSAVVDMANCSQNMMFTTPSRTNFYHLASLSPNTTYHIRVKVIDSIDSSLSFTSNDVTFTTKETQQGHADLTGTGDPAALQVSDTAAVVTIPTLNTDATSTLCYGTSAIVDMTNCAQSINFETPSRKNFYYLTNLNPNTTYHIRVRVTDSLAPSLSFNSGEVTFMTKKIQVDKQDALAVVSTPESQDVEVYTNGAFISWSSDQPTNTLIQCSTVQGGPYDGIFTSNQSDYDKHHTTKIAGLVASTKYYCQISATDDSAPATTLKSGEFSFTTTTSAIFNHDPLSKIDSIATPVENLSDTNAVVTFSTDQVALCLAELTTSQGSYTNPLIVKESGYDQNQNYSTSHTLRLINLIFATPYYFRITCHDNLVDGGGSFSYITSAESSFITKEKLYTTAGFDAAGDHIAPVISGVSVSVLNGESATVTWNTDENASSVVDYGLLAITENGVLDPLVNSDKTKFTTTHTVTLVGLVPATKYLFIAESTDLAGNISQSAESSFTTQAPSSISSINAKSTSLGQAVISWFTSTPLSSIVEYGLTTSYEERKESSALVNDHSIDLAGLNQGVIYHYRVKGLDKNKKLYASSDQTFEPKSPAEITNVSVDNIDEHGATVTFKTNVPTDSNVAYIDKGNNQEIGSQGSVNLTVDHNVRLTNLKQGTDFAVSITVSDEQGTQTKVDGPSFTTNKDEKPPVIENVKTDNALTQADGVQTIISWKTDEQSSTSIFYKEGHGGQEKEFKSVDALTTNHVGVITIFKPGTVYTFRVKSVDPSGNESISGDFVMLTPSKRANIIQVIIGNFGDIFSWVKLN